MRRADGGSHAQTACRHLPFHAREAPTCYVAVSRSAAALVLGGAKRIDASRKYVIPGGIDVHTHVELPFGGTFASDDFETGTVAAAVGGTTTKIDIAVQGFGEPVEKARDA
ncbi:MAG: amidohydrolase family protein [Chloroflexota bacterium]|nr:amidohydrolase family protein [Chloroflexota bacterium]